MCGAYFCVLQQVAERPEDTEMPTRDDSAVSDEEEAAMSTQEGLSGRAKRQDNKNVVAEAPTTRQTILWNGEEVGVHARVFFNTRTCCRVWYAGTNLLSMCFPPIAFELQRVSHTKVTSKRSPRREKRIRIREALFFGCLICQVA